MPCNYCLPPLFLLLSAATIATVPTIATTDPVFTLTPCPQAVSSPATTCPLLLPLLVDCCVVIPHLCPLLSSHTAVQPSALLFQATFTANQHMLLSGGLVPSNCPPLLPLLMVGCCIVICRPLLSLSCHCPLQLPLLLPLGCHSHHCHHCCQTHQCPLPKKEATAAPPPVYQWQHQRENVYKSCRPGLLK